MAQDGGGLVSSRLTAHDAAMLEMLDSFSNVSQALLESQVEHGTTESSRSAAAAALAAAARVRPRGLGAAALEPTTINNVEDDMDAELREYKVRAWKALAEQRHRPPPTIWSPNFRATPQPQQQQQPQPLHLGSTPPTAAKIDARHPPQSRLAVRSVRAMSASQPCLVGVDRLRHLPPLRVAAVATTPERLSPEAVLRRARKTHLEQQERHQQRRQRERERERMAQHQHQQQTRPHGTPLGVGGTGGLAATVEVSSPVWLDIDCHLQQMGIGDGRAVRCGAEGAASRVARRLQFSPAQPARTPPRHEGVKAAVASTSSWHAPRSALDRPVTAALARRIHSRVLNRYF